ncbi:MAG: hypothetical protein A2W34_07830 [Chloroflexi bacterium RBG_16_64_32]|nr:MAG: hypothetical protein A2W34_07830 [Chloroflexi bacterium RBG_16_64_32]
MSARRPIVAIAFVTVFLLFLATACGGGGGGTLGVKSERVAAADRAAAMAIAPDGRLFFGEQVTGAIRVVSADGVLQEEPFAQLEVATYVDLDWGLTGLALDPDFEMNHYLYAFLTEPVEPDTPVARPVVVRFTDRDSEGVDREVIVNDLPETLPATPGFNANGNIHFGPDGFLYLSLGDYDAPPLVQNLSMPIGKLLRVDKDNGSPAPGNPLADDPDADPRIYAYGFREPFDFAFHPEAGAIYGSDNTTVSCEEINLIEPGANYGWPDVGEFPYSDCGAGEGKNAIHLLAHEGTQPGDFLSFVEVSGLAFASAGVYPLLGDSLLVCESQTMLLRRLVLGGPDLDQVTADDIVAEDCRFDVEVSPDGTIYYSNADEIRRLAPTSEGP